MDSIRKLDVEKERNPRPVKMKFIKMEGGTEVQYVKIEPMAFDNIAFEGVKGMFEKMTIMRE